MTDPPPQALAYYKGEMLPREEIERRRKGETTKPQEAPKMPETTNPPKEPKAELDGFNMADFVINPATAPIIVKKVLTTVPVKRPNKQKFFRVLPGPEWEVSVPVLELKEEGEYYLIRPDVLPHILSEIKYVRLNLGYYMDGNAFLIPVPLPDADNPSKWNSWHRSLDEAVKAAKEKWIRAIPDKTVNGYTLMVASGNFEAPALPADMKLPDYVRLGFKDRIIDTPDHPVVKQLQGRG